MESLLVVGVDFEASSGEEEFNDWYSKVHVGDVLTVPGVIRGSRYVALRRQEGQTKYLATYDIESEELAHTIFKTPEWRALMADWDAKWGGHGAVGKFAWRYTKIYSSDAPKK